MDSVLHGEPLRNVSLVAVHDVLQCHLLLFSPGKHGWGKAVVKKGFPEYLLLLAFTTIWNSFLKLLFFSPSLVCGYSGLFCLFSCSQFPYYVDLSFCLTVFLYRLSTAHMCLLILISFHWIWPLSKEKNSREFLVHACPQLLRSYVCGRNRKGSEFKEFNM